MRYATSRGLEALRHPDFVRYFLARFFATLAVQMQGVAVGWQVYEITGQTLDLGLVGLAQFLPFVLLILPAGQLADRRDRRGILFACYAAEALCGSLLLLASTLQPAGPWPIFLIIGIYGAARAFMMPAGQAILPNLVPARDFPNAVALSSSSFQIAVITGPALGGVLYLLGAPVVYFVEASLLTVAMTLMLFTRLRQDNSQQANRAAGRSLLEGLRFVRSRPVILGAISLDLFAVLFGGATAMLPAIASDILQVGPTGLGLLRTAPGVGAAVTALMLAYFPIRRHVGRWMFNGVALFGVATVLFGISDYFPLSLFALFLLGMGDMISVYIRQMLVQLETPDAIRGRVSAVNSVFIGASNELGEFESGVTASLFGLVPSVILGGVATLVVMSLWSRLFPVLRDMDEFPRAKPPA